MKKIDKLGRQRARHLALQALYQWLLTGFEAEVIYQQSCDFGLTKEIDLPYFKELLFGVINFAPDIDQAFLPFLDRLPKDLTPVEKTILRIATFELMYKPELPYKVVISEALELAKNFGATDAYKFVNGVLHQASSVLRCVTDES